MKKGSFEAINSPEFILDLQSTGEAMNSAFKTLVKVTHNPLLYYIKRYIFSAEEAQEVLQDVYLGIYKGIRDFQGNSKLSTWVYSLTHNKVCDKISDKKWQHEEYTEFKEASAGVDLKVSSVSKSTEWNTSPDKLSSIREVKEKLPDIIGGLSDSLKEVYVMRDVEGLSSGEVAGILKISEEAVRVRLHRARNTIVDNMRQILKTGSPKSINLSGADSG